MEVLGSEMKRAGKKRCLELQEPSFLRDGGIKNFPLRIMWEILSLLEWW